MKFSAVIGNPPYNNDVYLPFVIGTESQARICSCFITPAKWHAKLSDDNERFRKTIANRMSHIIYFPEETDVFDIRSTGGITIYLIGKNDVTYKQLDIKSDRAPQFNYSSSRELNFNEWPYPTLNTLGQRIVDKVVGDKTQFRSMQFNNLLSNDNRKRYTALFSTKVIYSGSSVTKHFYSANGKTNVISSPRVYELGDNNLIETDSLKYIFTSDSKEEIENFNSWINSKFIRFLVLMGNVLLTGIMNDEVWRFVPYTSDFSTRYSDKYFYDKYGLDNFEIKLIEDTIN